jgi:two-component system cell cycle response regulator DivK
MSAEMVLVVEDNPTNMLLARAVLERAGYRIEPARSAEEARQRLRTLRPDLILMDIHLPGEDGLALTRALKADPATADIPIAALTAQAMDGDRELARQAGCDAYISKPYNARQLPLEIAEIIESHRARTTTIR